MALIDGDAKDRDETRRLLYMALVCGKTKRYNLAGTLINAMRHHQGNDDPLLELNVVALVNAGEDAEPGAEQWARDYIGYLTDEIDGADGG